MLTEKRKLDITALLSVIPLSMAMHMIDTPLNWGMYVLVFLSGIDQHLKDVLRRSTFVATAIALINFSWLVHSTSKYIGEGGVYLGLILLLAICIFSVIYAGLIGSIFVLVRWHNRKSKYNWFFNSLLAGCILGAADIIMSLIGKGFSSCMFYNYLPIAYNIYALQPVAFVGPFLISFIIGMTNFQMAYFIRYRKFLHLSIPLLTILGYLCIGLIIFNRYLKEESNKNFSTIKIALISDGRQRSVHWYSTNGNRIIEKLLDLNKQVVDQECALAIWPETTIPWYYYPQDPFLQELKHQSGTKMTSHIMGINTFIEGKSFYSSMYSIDHNGIVQDRYDKRETLFLTEKGFPDIDIPFLPIQNVYEGKKYIYPIKTAYGKLGVLMDNEITSGTLCQEMGLHGAQLLLHIGDDSFLPKYISKQHFYLARVRAIENCKDLLANNRNGLTGLIRSTGEIVNAENSSDLKAHYFNVSLNNKETLLMGYPYFGISLAFGIPLFFVITIVNFKINKNQFFE